MLITRIELENIKSYRQISFDFRRGTTAISGANGAGKTTIVEAIGYALFDYLPYNQAQFVREGEKYGHIVIHLIGSDDRPYVVDRRCGSSASWTIYDREADSRLEQRADLLDKLHELFGIDRERSLPSLFKDALGVPQGSFTAIFLEPASKRNQTFNNLLQIEDYKTAADNLLEVQKEYKEQIVGQDKEIQRLTFETRDVASWRTELATLRQLEQEQTEQFRQWTRQQETSEQHLARLTRQRDEFIQLQHEFQHSRQVHEATQQRLTDSLSELQKARDAQQLVEANSASYTRYLQTSEVLKGLRQNERQRNELRQQQASQHTQLTKMQTNIAHIQIRLTEVAEAKQRIVDLLPQVDEQVELEKQRDELNRSVTQYEGLVTEGKRLVKQHAAYLQQQEHFQKRIAEIEPLRPIAALLQERVEAVAQLRAQGNERTARQRQLQEKREQLRLKQEERETYATRLRHAESTITKIEAHRAEAEELPTLQLQYEQFSEQRFRLEGNIEGYTKSRQQSIGGQCPFLHEPCLNIKQRGVVSLESYFDGMVREDSTRLIGISQQQQTLSERMNSVKKFADALGKLGQVMEQRDNQAEHLQRLAIEITRLDREVTEFTQDLEALKVIDAKIAQAEAARTESQKADVQVRELDGLRMQVHSLQEQAQQSEELIQERRQQAKALSGSAEQLTQVKQQLDALNDPRAQTRAQHDKVKLEPTYQRQLQAEQQKAQAAEQQLQVLDQQLTAYAELDMHIGEQEALLQQTLMGYQTYLANEKAARLLPQRQQAYQELARAAEQAQQGLQAAEAAFKTAEAAFHPEELATVDEEVKQLRRGLIILTGKIQQAQTTMRELEQKISQAEAFLIELETAEKEKATLEELQTMLDYFRKLIKEAAPHVLKAMLGDISAEANRIFGEIMGDRAAQLSWQNDYEIVLRRQGVNRSFAQLSGGEQMSAALSVRLALLKKLSTLNIAFFDEPTQNMDELRRMNLAEQIRRVRGFDQLLVISHDDTFEQGLDSLIRLRKIDGETHQLTEEEMMARAS